MENRYIRSLYDDQDTQYQYSVRKCVNLMSRGSRLVGATKMIIMISQIHIVIQLFILGKLETKPWKLNINNMEYMVVCPL